MGITSPVPINVLQKLDEMPGPIPSTLSAADPYLPVFSDTAIVFLLPTLQSLSYILLHLRIKNGMCRADSQAPRASRHSNIQIPSIQDISI